MSIAYEPIPCPACGSRDSTLVADADGIRAERERLWEFHTRRLRAGTPPRHLADRLAFSQPDAWRLVQCAGCTLVYRNPIERAQAVTDLYAGEEPDPAVLQALHDTQRDAYRDQTRRLTAIMGRAGSVLEVGSFVGGFLAAARERGWQARGADVNPRVNGWVRAQGHAVHDGGIESADGAPVDVVAFWNCFDQLADPAAALRAAAARLVPGGRVVVRVPNGACYASLRQRRRPLANTVLALNNLLGFPYRFGFTPRSLAHVLGRAGFTMEQTVGDTLVPTADRWTRPWAHVEERAVKSATRLLARTGAIEPPWLEAYARLAVPDATLGALRAVEGR